MEPVTASVELTGKEIQTLTAAMAGNFPASLAEHRVPVLRKLAAAHRDHLVAIDAALEDNRRRLIAQGLWSGS